MKKAFTLIELIVVMIIIAVLASAAMPRYFSQIENARKTEAYFSMRTIRTGELAYYTKYGSYKATLPFGVDLDGDKNDDIYVAVESPNFIFSLNVAKKYIKAAKITGLHDYYMCLESGKVATDQVPTCFEQKKKEEKK